MSAHSRSVKGADVEPQPVRLITFGLAALWQLIFVAVAVLFSREGLWFAACVVAVLGVFGGLGMVWVEARR